MIRQTKKFLDRTYIIMLPEHLIEQMAEVMHLVIWLEQALSGASRSEASAL